MSQHCCLCVCIGRRKKGACKGFLHINVESENMCPYSESIREGRGRGWLEQDFCSMNKCSVLVKRQGQQMLEYWKWCFGNDRVSFPAGWYYPRKDSSASAFQMSCIAAAAFSSSSLNQVFWLFSLIGILPCPTLSHEDQVNRICVKKSILLNIFCFHLCYSFLILFLNLHFLSSV